MNIQLTVNGQDRTVEISPDMRLLDLLRDVLGL
ncbi:MAG: (2Fe-2S)-binding protein, partial [Synergistales bacterium]|nr:(2Fe-2S)-binding protein [Synergistales bacterium]